MDNINLSSKDFYPKNKLRKRIYNTRNFFYQCKKAKSPLYYQKIYTLSSADYLDEEKSENNKSPKQLKKKIISLNNIFKKPQIFKNKFQYRKITYPKSPFSRRITKSKKETKNQNKLSKSSNISNDFTTRNWLRKKFSENIINKSIYTLLPNNGKPVIPENESEANKRHRKMIEYLESLKHPMDREKYININPKYFFTKETFNNVLKLKKIFLEFDKDGNRRMELDEMLEMFMSNKISASINDLVELFFKGKKFKEKDVLKLYLNFSQFINFALTKNEEFRQFMRNIKERREKEKKNIANNNIEGPSDNYLNDNYNYTGENDGYLPMSFNSLLDYFIDKGKERESKAVINKAIEEMNKIINKTKKRFNICNSVKRRNDKEKTTDFPKLNNGLKKVISNKKHRPSESKSIKHHKHISHENFKKIISEEEEIEKINLELNLDDKVNDYESQLKNINFKKIIEEFYNLINVDTKFELQKYENANNLYSSSKKNNEKNEQKINQNEREQNKTSMIKSHSQSILNSFLNGSQEKMINNLKNSTKADSNIFHKSQNDISSINDFKINNDKNKLISSLSTKFYNNKISKKKYLNFDNYSRNKIDINFNYFQSKQKANLLENKTFFSLNQSQVEIPLLYNKIKIKNKSKNNLGFYSNTKNQKNRFYKSNSNSNIIYPLSSNMKENAKNISINKEFYNNAKNNKFFMSFYGGKINMIHNRNCSNIKLDYIPINLMENLKYY